MTDLDLQLELALRLVVAAILGAAIGLERGTKNAGEVTDLARLAAELPAAGAQGEPGAGGPAGEAISFGGLLPEALHQGFSTAMGQSIMLPAAVIVLGAAVALFFARPNAVHGWAGQQTADAESAAAKGP